MRNFIFTTMLFVLTSMMAKAVKPLSKSEISTITTTTFVSNTDSVSKVDSAKIVKFYTNPASVTASYVNDSISKIKITNFAGKSYDVVLNVDWDNGTVTMQPQVVAFVGIMGLLGQMTRYYIGMCADYSYEGISTTMKDVNSHFISGTVKDDGENVTFELNNAVFWQQVSTNAIVYHYPYTISIVAQRAISSGVDGVQSSKVVKSIQYSNLAGQVSLKPFNGVNVVKTTYADGTSSVDKRVYNN